MGTDGVASDHLLRQAREAQKTAEIFYLAHSLRARRWELTTRVMLGTAAILAAAGGVAAAASLVDTRIAGVASVVAGALGGLTLTLDTVRRASCHQTAADNYINFSWTVRNFCRMLESRLVTDQQAEYEWRVIDTDRKNIWRPPCPVSYHDKDYVRAEGRWKQEIQFGASSQPES